MIGTAAARFATYRTRGGVDVVRETEPLALAGATDGIVRELDSSVGVLLESAYEFPGRHRRWSVGFTDPPLSIVATGRRLSVRALNGRGSSLLALLAPVLRELPVLTDLVQSEDGFDTTVRKAGDDRPFEEERSGRDSVFSVLRALVELFGSDRDPHLGLYGAFGYDLVLQLEDIPSRLERPPGQRDMVLFLPDELVVVDGERRVASRVRSDFSAGGVSKSGLARGGRAEPFGASRAEPPARDHARGEYATAVRAAREAFRSGDLFEVVLSQVFSRPCPSPPSEIYRQLRRRSPAPYCVLMNLGGGEHLVSASPAMYVRVANQDGGRRVETCPISGTIARGTDSLGDADAVLELLASQKATSELTMCTDVDRNDKSRVCVPGTVRVIGRRQVEMYADVIHTMDHVVGRLRSDRDAIDAFLSHMWAVTVTGAPKLWAMRFIEDHERTPRRWYGGAMGYLAFNGEMSTGIILRTLHIENGVGRARAGATLLFDSDPDAEERESELKAGLFLEVLKPQDPSPRPARGAPAPFLTAAGSGRRVLLIDHEDSFVHTLGNYLRQTGAEVTTVRAPLPPDRLAAALDRVRPHLLVLSPGPGRPADFRMFDTLRLALHRELPVFGVCLGLQGIVEHFGGRLRVLDRPWHGRSTPVRVRGGRIFRGLPERFEVGRYHSLYVCEPDVPHDLAVTADADGVVMAVEHERLPVAATQFHPESVMTARDDMGLRIIANVMDLLARPPA